LVKGVLFVLLTANLSENIFFDGFLPLDKSKIRKARLEASARDLCTFHATFLDGFHVPKYANNLSSITASQLFDPLLSIPLHLRGLPTAAFLVPAVIDAIQQSEYVSITAVVPDEADPFCAGAACENGGIILTSDSDLLVYNLGTHGAVTAFNQLELGSDDESSRKCAVFRASVSQPSETAQRLGLDDLRQFSFELLRNPSTPLAELVKRARQPGPEPLPFDASRQKTFSEFCKDYDLKVYVETQGKDKSEDALFLDPRISELVLTSSSEPSIYLPSLMEDPSKTAAWNVSRDLRRFAYSCHRSQISDSSLETVLEYCCRGQRLESELVPAFSKNKVLSYTDKFAAGLENFKSHFSSFSHVTIWRTFALSEVLHWYSQTQKKAPSRNALAYSITGRTNNKISWLDIHLSAQMQAVLYSLRILKQLLTYSTPPLLNPQLSTPQAKCSSSADPFLRLNAILGTLPPLSQLLPSRLELINNPSTSTLNINHLLDLLASYLQPAPSPATINVEQVEIHNNNNTNSDPSTAGFQTVPPKRRRQLSKNKVAKKVSGQIKEIPQPSTNNIYNALL
jgi:hypothetical protein